MGFLELGILGEWGLSCEQEGRLLTARTYQRYKINMSLPRSKIQKESGSLDHLGQEPYGKLYTDLNPQVRRD